MDAGKSQTAPANVGENLYNRGVLNAMLMSEAIRIAQEKTGKTVITSEDMRIGLENLVIDEARLEAIGLPGFIAPLNVTCANHSGTTKMYISEWDGEKWVKASDWFEPMTDKVAPLLVSGGGGIQGFQRAVAGPGRSLAPIDGMTTSRRAGGSSRAADNCP